MSTSAQSVTAVQPGVLMPAVVEVFEQAGDVLKPPPSLTVKDWAEANRVIATESGAYAGKYRVKVAPYQAAMMNAVHIPGVEEIVFFTAAQIGKSTCMENIQGYFMHADPSSIICMWPTEKVAKEWSIDTLDPLLRETPALAAMFEDGSRKRANGTFFKKFPGGWLSIIGANAAANLRRRRARIVFVDEVDGIDDSAAGSGNKKEGDPIEIVASRSETFWNRLRVLASTCTIKGESRIEARYKISNRQKYWVPCPHCSAFAGKPDGFQLLKRANIDSSGAYRCEHCAALIEEREKPWMLEYGEWRADRPEITKIQGFWINKLYSPFVTWAQLNEKFHKASAQRHENPELLKAVVTLDLAETWEVRDEDLDKEGLVKRCEDYPPPALPDGVIVVTAGLDVQEDRILCEVVGWGKGFPNPESWSIDWHQFNGDTAKPEIWQQVDEYLAQEYLHARGIHLEIAAKFIDAGYHANEVYGFTKPRWKDRIFASRGSGNFNHVPLGRMNRNNKMKAPMYPVGVSQIKLSVYRWLKVQAPGPGYMHFSHRHNDADYFQQLTSETLQKDYKNGFPVKYWYKQPGARNEALDCRVYAYAALLSLSENPGKMLERQREMLLEEARKLAEARRKKIDPNQMALALPALEEAPAVQTSAPATKPEPQASAEEYKAAEQLDAKQETRPEPAPPKIVVRRGGWV